MASAYHRAESFSMVDKRRTLRLNHLRFGPFILGFKLNGRSCRVPPGRSSFPFIILLHALNHT